MRPFELGEMYRRSGDHVPDAQFRTVSEFVERQEHPCPSYVLLIYWPQSEGYLDVQVSWEADGNHGDFNAAPADLTTLLQRGGVPEAQATKSLQDVQATFHFRVAEVPATAALQFRFRVDTNGPRFVEATASETLELQLKRRIYPVPPQPRDPQRIGGGPVWPPTSPLLVRAGVGEMPYFEGAVAMDFGNTSSTLTCLEPHEMNTDKIEIVDAELSPADPASLPPDLLLQDFDHTVPSAVRLFQFEPAPDDDLLPEASWCIGRLAKRTAGGELILGAKRLVADPRQSEQRKIFLDQGSCVIPKDLAAELFVAKMFQGLYGRKRHRARQLALTYPATFSQQEISRLKHAVFKGVTRSLLASKYRNPVGILDRLIPVMLDEASAAAFFFLYRDFLRAPGRTSVLHYLYPQGLNILLYDCGGGTTDIALVHARPKRVLDENRQESWEVDLRVLGRTGHRAFGGDNITLAVAQVLKAELACQLNTLVKATEKFTFPSSELGFARFLKQNQTVIDYLIPTKYKELLKGDAVGDLNEFRLRRDATLELWNWAEAVKAWLGCDAADRPPAPKLPGDSKLAALVAKRHHGKVTADKFVVDVVEGKLLSTLGDRRPFVDVLIRSDLERTVAATNRMIAMRLTEATRTRVGESREAVPSIPPPAEPESPAEGTETEPESPRVDYPLPSDSCVHWVYVVGKASRYPLVRQLLQERLHVCDLDSSPIPAHADEGRPREGGSAPTVTPTVAPTVCRLRFDQETLKTSVACGAALALRMRFRAPEITVNWDPDLARRLPYTISHDGFGRGWRNLFLEHERYEDLKPQSIAVSRRREEQQDEGVTVTLYRKWPDGSTEKFLDFPFKRSLKGPLTVRYDDVDKCFKMRDDGTGEQDERTGEDVIGVEISHQVYVSPAQSGEL